MALTKKEKQHVDTINMVINRAIKTTDAGTARGWLFGFASQATHALVQVEQGDSLNAAAVLMVRRDDFEKLIAAEADYMECVIELAAARKKLSRAGVGGRKALAEAKLSKRGAQSRKYRAAKKTREAK